MKKLLKNITRNSYFVIIVGLINIGWTIFWGSPWPLITMFIGGFALACGLCMAFYDTTIAPLIKFVLQQAKEIRDLIDNRNKVVDEIVDLENVDILNAVEDELNKQKKDGN